MWSFADCILVTSNVNDDGVVFEYMHKIFLVSFVLIKGSEGSESGMETANHAMNSTSDDSEDDNNLMVSQELKPGFGSTQGGTKGNGGDASLEGVEEEVDRNGGVETSSSEGVRLAQSNGLPLTSYING